MPQLVVVVPAWNEILSITDVVTEVRALGLDCLVVDDGSTDGTAEASRVAGAEVVRLPFNVGIGTALRTGFRWAVQNGYDTVVQCDADGQHSPGLIRLLVDEWTISGSHLVIGSRFLAGGDYKTGFLRRFVMRRLASIATRAAGRTITDASSGFRLITQPLLGAFALSYPDDYMDSFEALVAAAEAGYRVSETSTTMLPRAAGMPSHGVMKAAGFTVRALIGGAFGARYHLPPLPHSDQ